jgi:hypothetical protein
LTHSIFNQEWAAFFLQGFNLRISQRLGYLSYLGPQLGKISGDQDKDCSFLSDRKIKGATWQNDIFLLQNHLDPLDLLEIDAPNGVETVQGDSFVWLNNKSTVITIYSDANRQAFLNISECWPGPNRPEDTKRTLIVEINGQRDESTASANLKVRLTLREGSNILRLACKEKPFVDRLASSDPRIMLLGIKGIGLTAAD